MTAPQVTELRVREVTITLRRAGRGATVLFLHGAGGVPHWLPFFDALAERYKVLVPEHPGFGDLCGVLKIHRDGLVAVLMHRKPDSEAASYADMVGHLRGLDEIVPLARGIVENGKNAAAELRGAEEESP